jgi:spore germination protein KA
MPTGIGQTLSIVGALVIGQAAVTAKLVAAPMIIVVGITGITSLLAPKMNASSIVLKFTILILASMFGIFGFLIASCFWLIHILNLKSFGIYQVNFLEQGWSKKAKDTFIRMPWTSQTKRPFDVANKNNLTRNRVENGETNE